MKFNAVKTRTLMAVLATTIFTANTAMADDKNVSYLDTCQNLPLISAAMQGQPNTTVCVDAPVAMEKTRVIFDMASDAVDGKGRHTGLRHMMMLGNATLRRINAGLMDADDVNIIGVMHGSGINLALDSQTNPVTKGLIEQIYALKSAGVNISLEVCGVTMWGRGLTNADLNASTNGMIHVNQGAIGRMIDLQQKKFALIKE